MYMFLKAEDLHYSHTFYDTYAGNLDKCVEDFRLTIKSGENTV